MNPNHEINRLAELVSDNGDEAGKSPPVAPPSIALGNTGVVARLDGQMVRVIGSDQTELFSFPAQAAPFDAQPLSFLLQIYSLGYNKGRVIGREVTKAKIREVLGVEL
jgi:hypothetical protein